MKNKGFTLIELLVVIAIIGLLSTLAVVSLNGARSKARDARRTSDLKAVSSALELHRDDHQDKIPTAETDWATSVNKINDVANTYLPAGAPTDPDTLRAGNNTYIYCAKQDRTFYLLRAVLENPSPGTTMTGEITTYAVGDCFNAEGTAGDPTALQDCGNNIAGGGENVFCLGKL